MKMKIGDISTYIRRGITPKYVVENGYAVVNQKCIRDGKVNYEYIKYTDIHKKYNEEKKVKQGDILINSTGTGTLGRVAYVDKDASYTYVDSHVTILRCENYNSKFLYYWLSSLEKYIESLGKGSTNQIELNKDAIEEIEIPKLDLEQQNIVVENLSTYDDLIENNQKQIKLLEEAAQRLYKEWFVDLHFPGYEDVKIVDGVPEGWTYKRVDEFGEVITGKTPSTSKTEYYCGSIPFVTIPDMHGKVFPLVTEKTLTKAGADAQRNKYLPVNSVIVSCIATVGLVNIAVEPCQTNQQINSVVLYNDNDLYFFYESMKRIKTLLDGVGSNGATMTNVNKTKFSNIHVLYPTEDLVKRYNGFCKPIFNNILALSKGILVSTQARDRLLPKLMSGEIEV
ncbi:restriction endonuclease subunit S [Arcanobacterium sp. S3PF19]|uniref:restriction endonuclease subunit S n=1 Tax=Arcanobacterium sp. S3PF19 TaxID=1219585 RepID=UPI00068D04D8|nr:restriction endonuclease subunit S [Arcanobacterium sp. S3PF19]